MEIKGLIKGLHHVTATVNNAHEDYQFYTGVLGQRLVKETVNFDNEKVYHFYYGNAIGLPSTIFTTFPYQGQGVRQGKIGTGQVYETVFSAPAGSLPFWFERLQTLGIEVSKIRRLQEEMLLFNDPSGLKLAIQEDGMDDRQLAWEAPGITSENAIKGIHHVILAVERPTETRDFLQLLGYEVKKSEGDFTFLVAGAEPAGNSLMLQGGQDLPQGLGGLGTVHHVALRVATLADSLRLKKYLKNDLGLQVTEVKDRKYFQSIYFRIPGGILFEIATEGPGFMVDENNAALGTSLQLPGWQEPHRERIRAGLSAYRR